MSSDKSLTPMMKQYYDVKKDFPDCLVFFRMGDFYEMFDKDAEVAASILGIALTKRNNIPMCGVPYHAKDNYLPKVLKAGRKVAICDQLEDPKSAKGIVKRGVTEVITPGTLVDDNLLEGQAANYLCSITFEENHFIYAACDISTGDLVYYHHPKIVDMKASIRSELAKLQPKEILISESLYKSASFGDLIEDLLPKTLINRLSPYYFQKDLADSFLKGHFQVLSLKGYGLDKDPYAIPILGSLLKYIHEMQLQDLGHIKHIRRIAVSEYLEIDEVTLKHLEILRNSYDHGVKDTLFSVLSDCKTKMGERLLYEWVCRPSRRTEEIRRRQQFVTLFYEDPLFMEEIRKLLSQLGDIQRTNSRISLAKVLPKEIRSLSESLKTLQSLHQLLSGHDLVEGLIPHQLSISKIITYIDKCLVEDPSNDFENGEIIRKDFSEELAQIQKLSKDSKGVLADIEDRERSSTGITSLKVRYNKVFGYYIEVSKVNSKHVPEFYMKKQTLVNAERYTIPELADIESKVNSATERFTYLQHQIFDELIAQLKAYTLELQECASAIAFLDLMVSFAQIALDYNYIKPDIHEGEQLLIVDGRHPVLERLIKRDKFIANDILMDGRDNRLLLLTGPNMAGKSTFLRQTALITIMAHIGSYIPATSANIPITDKVFSRVGANDVISKGESTFLVEMLETANILNNCTPKSLIIMDEVGRGTATYDGLSLAWAIIEYLTESRIDRGKTIFATHYHELTYLAKEKGIKNYQVLVREWEDQIIFLHKVSEGAANKSYGIQVARLAGIPEEVVLRAKDILKDLEEFSFNIEEKVIDKRRLREEFTGYEGQMNLFEFNKDAVIREFLKLIPENLSRKGLEKAISQFQDFLRKNKGNIFDD